MLNIKNSKYVTVFQAENKGKYVEANLSTGKKDQDGNWKNMSWLGARFVGKCKEQAEKLKDKDKIEIISGLIENNYVKETGKTYINVVIFEFEFMEKKSDLDEFSAIDDEEVPF